MNHCSLAERLAKLSWGGSAYSAYEGRCDSGPKKPVDANLSGDLNARAHDEINTRDNKIGSTDPLLDQFLPKKGQKQQDTPYYHALYTSGAESTAAAYNSAKANTKARANTAGFGYSSPVGQAADTGIDVAEAHDMAKLAPDTYTASLEPAFKAAAMRTGQAGLYQPLGYSSLALNADDSYKNRKYGLYYNDQQRHDELMGQLQKSAQSGLEAAAAFA